MTVRIAAAAACGLSLVLGCAKPVSAPPQAPVETALESGSLAAVDGSAARIDRAKPDVSTVGWVAGWSAEPVGSASGPWHSDLRLTNGTRLLVASSNAPELRFPAGYALPLAQILADVPEAWRGTQLVSAAPEGIDKIRWKLDVLPESATGVKRLYVLSLSLTGGDSAEAAPEPERWSLSSVPGSQWPLAAGQQVYKRKIADVPVDATVYAITAYAGPYARSLRFSDATDGKVLWDASVRPSERGPRIEPYRSDNGFVLLHDHEYEIEAAFEAPAPEPAAGTAILFLYYELSGDRTTSYPFPPAEE